MNLITLIKIGWRNIWINKKRSLVVILSIVLGLYGGLIISSLMITLNSQRMNTAINTYLADIQIHNKEFSKEYSLSDTISNIQSQLADASLDDLFPDIQNPLMPSIMDQGTIPGLNTGTPLNLPGVNPQALTNQGGNIPYNQMTNQQKINILFGRS